MTIESEHVQRELPFVPIAPAREVLTAAEETAAAIARANGIARELLELQGTDDPDAAFVSALNFLLRAVHVNNDYRDFDRVHPRIVLVVLIEKYGVENVRHWTRQIARDIAKAAKEEED